MQNKLQNMRIFVCVANANSFTAAARLLNTTIPQVSRAIAALEAHLHTRLLNRTTRRLALTEAGERYLHRCRSILGYLDEAEAEARDANVNPSGCLRVHCAVSLGQHYLVPAFAKYRQRYPDVLLDMTLSQRAPALVDEGFDVSVVVGDDELPSSGLIGVRLGETFGVLCASRDYLDRHGSPRRIADMARHACVAYEAPAPGRSEWELVGPDGPEHVARAASSFRVNSHEAMAVAIREGMGIGVLPVHAAIDGLRSGDFVRVMPQCRSPSGVIWALYSSRQYVDAKIRTWLDFLREELAVLQQAEAKASRSLDGRGKDEGLQHALRAELGRSWLE